MPQTSHDLAVQIEGVNALLKDGEPGNLSEDKHANPPRCGYDPQSVVDAMNQVFGPAGAWGFSEESNEIVLRTADGGREKPVLAVAKVKVWLKGSDFQPTAWGQGRVTQGDEGDAHKAAQTDAIKKALSYYSIGNRAYLGLLGVGGQAAATAQTGTRRVASRQTTKGALAVVSGEPDPTSPMNTNQRKGIEQLCHRLSRPTPDRLDEYTFGEAHALIADLQGELRQLQAGGARS